MATPIRMPQPGQMTEECTIVRWLKGQGQRIARGDPLFEIETDKSNMEVEAFEDGLLLRVLVGEGETVPVDTIVAWVGQPGEPVPDAEPARATTPTEPAGRLAVSPRAARLAADLGVDPRTVTGTGPGGRIVERDVRPAGPSEPLGRLRQVTAGRLTESVTTIPQLSVSVAVDMTGLVALRADLRAAGSPISLTDLVHAATIQALVEHPLVNALTDGRTVWRRERVHLGVAVSLPGGSLVPVVRDADGLGLADLHERTAALVAGARAGRLGPVELAGSTFTVSNMGMLEVERFTALVNPGESGILAVASVRPEAVARGGGLAVRQMMRVTLSADHRLVDAELGARFLNTVRRRLEDAEGFRALLLAD